MILVNGISRKLHKVSPYSINNNKFSECESINQYRELPYLENIGIYTDYRGLLCNRQSAQKAISVFKSIVAHLLS